MGFEQGGNKKAKRFFSVNGQTGLFVESVKDVAADKWIKVVAEPGSTMTGTLLSIDIVNSVNKDNEAVIKAKTVFASPEHDEPDMSVEVVLWRQTPKQPDPNEGEATSFGLAWLATLNGANVDLPMRILPWAMTKGSKFSDETVRDRDGSGISVRQNGVKVQKVYIENGQPVSKLADLPKSVFANKTTYDKSGWNQVLTDTFNSIAARLNPAEAAGDHDHDDSIDPDQAAQAAQAGASQAPRARA